MKQEKENSDKRIKERKPVKTANDIWVLRLYVAGQTPKALTAFTNLKKIYEEQLNGKYSIEVIDLLINPQLGSDDQILALPTLVRKLPVPVRKIIGDLKYRTCPCRIGFIAYQMIDKYNIYQALL